MGERTRIAPIWANQSWFPLLLGCLVNFPIILPETPALLRNPVGNLKPSKTSRLKSVWDQAKDRGFLEEAVPHGEVALRDLIYLLGQHGFSGAEKEFKIPFQELWLQY